MERWQCFVRKAVCLDLSLSIHYFTSIAFSQPLFKYEGCGHHVVMRDLCAECGANLRKLVMWWILNLKNLEKEVFVVKELLQRLQVFPWCTWFPICTSVSRYAGIFLLQLEQILGRCWDCSQRWGIPPNCAKTCSTYWLGSNSSSYDYYPSCLSLQGKFSTT